tara:strand:+ start:1505 stop:1654 length:150 start_codon:yes stop_codon:yes gene_type:complete
MKKGTYWDGKSRVSNNTYRKRFDEIFNQARKFVYGQSKLNKKEYNNGKK